MIGSSISVRTPLASLVLNPAVFLPSDTVVVDLDVVCNVLNGVDVFIVVLLIFNVVIMYVIGLLLIFKVVTFPVDKIVVSPIKK